VKKFAYAAAAALLLQGCVAAVVPVVAAGAIGKNQIDRAKKRARAAEEPASNGPIQSPEPSIAATNEPEIISQAPSPSHNDSPSNNDDEPKSLTALDRIDASDINSPYLPFVRYAIGQSQKRRDGLPLKSAVLVEQVSLSDPKTVACNDKPLAVIIDLDNAPDAAHATDGNNSAKGFIDLMALLRESGITIGWISEWSGKTAVAHFAGQMKNADGFSAIVAGDKFLHARSSKQRKQELRWTLARDYCVIAVAGDRNGDFDELFDYLRNADYAIQLEMFMGNGWFRLPDPVTVHKYEFVKTAQKLKD
jgi:hypothetical protein